MNTATTRWLRPVSDGRPHWRYSGHDPRCGPISGPVLRVAAQASDGRWIVVALIEETDDEYLVVSARELTATEQVAVVRMIEGEA